MIRSISLILLLALTGCSMASTSLPANPSRTLPDLGSAPELANETWLNVDAPLRLADLPAIRVKQALMLPRIYDSEAEIARWRARFDRGLDELLQSEIRLQDPSREVDEHHFFMHYLDEPWLEQAIKLGAFYRKACPQLLYTAPHCRGPRRKQGERLRLGVVAPNFRQHSVAKLFGEIVPRLDRSRFELVFCTPAAGEDPIVRRYREGKAVSRIENGGLVIDPRSHAVLRDGERLSLSQSEFALLLALASRLDEEVGWSELLQEVWGTDSLLGGRDMVKTAIYRLRGKLGESSVSPRYIHSVRGLGYRMPRLPPA